MNKRIITGAFTCNLLGMAIVNAPVTILLSFTLLKTQNSYIYFFNMKFLISFYDTTKISLHYYYFFKVYRLIPETSLFNIVYTFLFILVSCFWFFSWMSNKNESHWNLCFFDTKHFFYIFFCFFLWMQTTPYSTQS